jgi:hypothetical protein
MSVNEAIYNFIVSITNNIYDPNNIIQGFQSNIVTPTNQPFIEITEGDTKPASWYPDRTFDPNTMTKTYSESAETNWQIDFYGIPARATAASTRLLLMTIANQWFIDNNYNLSVASVHDYKNLTDIIDSEVYIARWCLKFSIFNTVIVTNTPFTFTSVVPGLINADLLISNNPEEDKNVNQYK